MAELSALFRDQDKNLTEDTKKKQPRWQADTKPRGGDVVEGKGRCVRLLLSTPGGRGTRGEWTTQLKLA